MGRRKIEYFTDLTNQCFMFLRVKYKAINEEKPKTRKTLPYWACLCHCGKNVIIQAHKLIKYGVTSCGCMNKMRKKQYFTKGELNLRSRYEGMVRRCTDPDDLEYHNYGGRGISIEKEWQGSEGRKRFIAWGMRYHMDMYGEIPKNYQIDRIDNDGPYAWWNCRFVPPAINSQNRRNNRIIYLNDKKCCFNEVAKYFNNDVTTILVRLRQHWSLAEAFSIPGYGNKSQWCRIALNSKHSISSLRQVGKTP